MRTRSIVRTLLLGVLSMSAANCRQGKDPADDALEAARKDAAALARTEQKSKDSPGRDLALAPARPAAGTESSGKPTAFLPSLDQELAGRRIGWAFNDVRGSLTAAAADGKPIVFVFTAFNGNCGWCEVLEADTLRCPAFNALAGQAHFTFIDVGPEQNAETAALSRHYHITSYPATVVVSVKGKAVDERLQLTGSMNEDDLLAALARAGLRASDPNPASLSTVAMGTYQPRSCSGAKTPGARQANLVLRLGVPGETARWKY